MNLLELAGGWWSSAGLAMDVAGFTILAIDLLPGYRVHTTERAIKALGQRMLPPERDWPEDIRSVISSGSLENCDELQRSYAYARALATLRLSEREQLEMHEAINSVLRTMAPLKSHIRSMTRLFYPGERQGPLIAEDAILDRYIFTLRAYKDLPLWAFDRQRPSIRIGILLVLLGFAAQLIGNLPL